MPDNAFLSDAQRQLDGLAETLALIASADILQDEEAVLEHLFGDARRRRDNVLRERRSVAEEQGTARGIGATVARNLKRLRKKCGGQQKEVAAQMNRLGFDTWVETTVSDAEFIPKGKEKPKRGVSFEELVGLATIFETSVVELLVQADDLGDPVRLNDHLSISRWKFRQILVGDQLSMRDDPNEERSDLNALQASRAIRGYGIVDGMVDEGLTGRTLAGKLRLRLAAERHPHSHKRTTDVEDQS